MRKAKGRAQPDLLSQIVGSVERLLAENRDLRRRLAAVQSAGPPPGLVQLHRSLERAVGRPTGNGEAAAVGSARPRARRARLTDPAAIERRRASLARARAAKLTAAVAGAAGPD